MVKIAMAFAVTESGSIAFSRLKVLTTSVVSLGLDPLATSTMACSSGRLSRSCKILLVFSLSESVPVHKDSILCLGIQAILALYSAD